MKIPVQSIKTKKDVHTFFSWLVAEHSLNFHPDTPFSDYVNTETGKPTFTTEQVGLLQPLIDQAFHVAEVKRFDIYSIGIKSLTSKI